MKTEKKLVNFRISETLADELREVSEELEIPQSQIAREALREKVGALRAAINTPVAESIHGKEESNVAQ